MSFFVLVAVGAGVPLVTGVPRVGKGPRIAGFAVPRTGVDAAEVGVRALFNDAAVGLLKRSAALLLSVGFLIGIGSCGCAFRALARDAAVGAKRPEGVFGRVVLGVLGRVVVALGRGVLERDGVLGTDLGIGGFRVLVDEVD